MNIDSVKELINKMKFHKVHVEVKGMRNKSSSYNGIIKETFPNIFIVETLDGEKSISYVDVIIKDVKLTFFD